MKHYVTSHHIVTNLRQSRSRFTIWNPKNTQKEVFIQQITLANPRQQHLDMTYSSTAANFKQWKKHQLAPVYVIRTLIGFNLWWLLIIVGVKIKARLQLKQ